MREPNVKTMTYGIAALGLIFLSGCASFTGRNVVPVDYDQRVMSLSKKLHKQDAVLKDLRNENLVLREIHGVGGEKTNDMVTDAELFTKAKKAYKKFELQPLVKLQRAITLGFPQSPYADNVLFLTGHLYLRLGQYAEALKYFDRVVKDYPKSNKMSQVIYSKAVAYKKLKLKDKAELIFADVVEKYPESRAARHAARELRKIK